MPQASARSDPSCGFIVGRRIYGYRLSQHRVPQRRIGCRVSLRLTSASCSRYPSYTRSPNAPLALCGPATSSSRGSSDQHRANASSTSAVAPAISLITFRRSTTSDLISAPAYVRAARARYGERGIFRQADVLDVDLSGEPRFDIVIAMGILHHLDDVRATRLVEMARAVLVPGGRLVTWDGAFVDGQPRAARWLIERDRGQYVREPESYGAIARQVFPDADIHVVSDGLRVPYTHCVVEARRDAVVSARR